jgi:conjugal transfer pilus assembly protein TrbC
MLFIVVYTLIFTVLSGPLAANEVDMTWVQDILKTKEANKDKHHQLAYEIIQGTTGIKNKAASNTDIDTSTDQKVCRSSVASLEEKSSEDRYPSLLVFVSFSMPMESLKALGEQVHKAGGKLVFRGLVDGSFPATSKKMQELGVDALIDPTLFEAYQVKVCPVFVLSDKLLQTVEEKPSYDQLSGHVSLHHALETFRRHGNSKAATLLQDLRGGSK